MHKDITNWTEIDVWSILENMFIARLAEVVKENFSLMIALIH